MNNIGQRIKELRKKNDLTQEKLADFLGVTYKAVSKWECGITVPDLSLIVPLAKLLHVTTDELLGMVMPETDERKLEYDAIYERAHQPEQLELAQKASLEYPGELKYIIWQADCMYLLAHDSFETQEKFYDDLEKSLKLYYVVYENTNDDKLKNKAVAGIVMTLAALNRNDEAEKYAELYNDTSTLDKSTVMGWALTGKRKSKHMQQALLKHLDCILSILIDNTDSDNLRESDSLDCAETLINTMIPSGEYNRYYDALFMINVYKAQIFANRNPEKAVEELKKARFYAEKFDDLFMNAPAVVPFNSPYFNLLNFDSADLLVYGPLENNKRIDSFKWWLSGQCFDALRDRNDFQTLLND